MKHIELIELIYKYRHTIDEAFGGEPISELPNRLIQDAAIFQRVAKEYELSDSYIQFANAMLKRVDANYTFGDYKPEIKRLMQYKADYLETQDAHILLRIKELARTLYKKIEQRDILINARINDIISDNDLSIELIIKDAKDIDERITDLIEAHAQNLKILGTELRGLDDALDEMLKDISIDLLPFIENIHLYNNRLSDFILRTQKRKEQNKKLASLSNKIIKEQDHELKSLLLSNPQLYHHTLVKKRNIKYLPSSMELGRATFVAALGKILYIEKASRKAVVEKPYKKSQTVKLQVVRLELIQQDINADQPADIYNYILEHPEIRKFTEDQTIYAFKAYLTIVQNNRKNITLERDYNNNNIRITKWI